MVIRRHQERKVLLCSLQEWADACVQAGQPNCLYRQKVVLTYVCGQVVPDFIKAPQNWCVVNPCSYLLQTLMSYQMIYMLEQVINDRVLMKSYHNYSPGNCPRCFNLGLQMTPR